MHLDGTGLPVQDSEAAGGKRLGALWGYVGVNAGEGMAAYLYVSSGKKAGQRPNERGPQDILSLRNGLTVDVGADPSLPSVSAVAQLRSVVEPELACGGSRAGAKVAGVHGRPSAASTVRAAAESKTATTLSCRGVSRGVALSRHPRR
jgi:hypothetical protein